MRKVTIFIVAAFMLVLCGTPVLADGIPPLPHAFYGDVTINGHSAPAGTTIEARGTGVLTGIEGNPITTTEPGKFGKAGALEPKLIVQDDILEGAEISFYVNGHSTGQVAEWHSGETTELNLSVTITGGGGGFNGGALTVETNLLGEEADWLISEEGEVLETVEATTEDGNVTLTIEEGTIALDEEGERLEIIDVIVDETPPDPPEDADVIGLAYDFGPDGATFNPAITIEFTYDPAALPEGVAEEDLVLAFYDEDTGEWVELTCTVDPVTNTITAFVDHFTTFAIIGMVKPATFTSGMLNISPLEVNVGETVTISLLVSNTGGKSGSHTVSLKINGVKEADKSVTVAAGDSETVTFSVTKEEAGNYSVEVDGLTDSFIVAPALAPAPPPTPAPAPAPAPIPPAKPPIDWPVVGGIIAGVIAVGLLIFFLVRRKAY